MTQKKYDVLILGAGAAGLACARKLLEKNLNIQVIEARPRAGGRMLSLQKPGSAMPIELGAEFIHGAPESTLDLMRTFSLPFYDIQDSHLHWTGKKMTELPQFFEKIEALNAKLAKTKSKDASVGQFLRSQKSLSPQWKQLYRRFIEGFQSADIEVISQQALSYEPEQSAATELNGTNMFRLARGYSELIERLSETLLQKDILKLNLCVKKIRWSQNDVQVECQSDFGDERVIFHASKLVVTLPLGVLKNQHETSKIEWTPLPTQLDSILDAMEMGNVQRLVFRFRTRFWEELATDKPLSFIHMQEDCDFPTWWTLAPIRSTTLVAWQGGPRAKTMSQWSKSERIRAALQTLSQWSGRPVSWLMQEMEFCETHDWNQDPFSLGAYSYIKVDGLQLAQKFSQPVSNTLYFAGEATCMGEARGTVHGAIESGQRAAEQILKSPTERKSKTRPFKSRKPHHAKDTHHAQKH